VAAAGTFHAVLDDQDTESDPEGKADEVKGTDASHEMKAMW
jgi:hypothetical protein